MAYGILGLDIGTTAVKGVLLDSAFRGYSVVDAAAVPVAPGEAPLRERQMAALRELLGRGWNVETSIVAFPGATAASYLVTLPFSDPKRIEQTVQFEVEGQIPFDLAEVSWDWQVLGTRGGKTDLYVGVVRKEELAGLLAGLAGVGVDPRVVIPAGPAYASLFGAGALAGEAAAEQGTEPPVEVVLDIDQDRVSVCIVWGGRCEAARTFPGGSGQLGRALAREIGISEAEATLVLQSESSVGRLSPELLSARAADPRTASALRRSLVPIARELRATLKAWEARVGTRQVKRLLLAGEMARLPGLGELFASEAPAAVEPIALAGPVSERIPPTEAPGLALAFALALRGHQGSRSPRLNLRRGDLAYTRDFQHLRGKVVRLGVYAGLVLLLALVGAGAKFFALSRQEALLDKALCDVMQKVVGRCFDDFSVAESVLKGRGTPTAAIPRVSSVDVLSELAIRSPPEVTLRFDRIEITRDKLHLVGTTDAAENVDRIVAALRKSRCFAEARSGGARRRSTDGKFEFSIDSDLACEGTSPGGKG
jgi:general secretion pathway protein L